MKRSAIMVLAFLALTVSACNKPKTQAVPPELQAIQDLENAKKITHGESARRVRDFYKRDPAYDEFDEAYMTARISIWTRFDKGQLSFEDAKALDAGALAERQNRKQTKQVAKNTNCISARQDEATTDHSGLNSTSGAVAIISLLGTVAQAAHTAEACN
jgi:hypothetical protein